MMTSTERYGGGAIVVCDYDPTWPARFEREQQRLRGALGVLATSIEHVGSTAVPGLAAKPIIDLLVCVESLEAARAPCIAALEGLGYIYMAEYEAWLPSEMLFRQVIGGRWVHHLHVLERYTPRWEELILVREYLRRHPEERGAYSSLKKALALTCGEDIAGYREAKRPFLQALLGKARAEQRDVSD